MLCDMIRLQRYAPDDEIESSRLLPLKRHHMPTKRAIGLQVREIHIWLSAVLDESSGRRARIVLMMCVFLKTLKERQLVLIFDYINASHICDVVSYKSWYKESLKRSI